MIKAGVIGYPIEHSKSPIIHGHWIDQYGLDGTYEHIEAKPEDLSEVVSRLKEEGYAGFNVTVPHKETIMALCDEIDETATHIGAVNTVKIQNGQLFGTNTDAYGFIENIKSAVPEFDFSAKPAFVLGAGGAAKAVIYALIQEGVSKIILTNRTIEKCNIIKGLYQDKIDVVPWESKEDYLKDIGLLVNTTSLGMTGKPDLELDLSRLSQDALVHDIVYAPLMTDLLKQGQDNQNRIVTGIGMLLHQARPAFEKWFGVLPEIDDTLEKKVLA